MQTRASSLDLYGLWESSSRWYRGGRRDAYLRSAERETTALESGAYRALGDVVVPEKTSERRDREQKMIVLDARGEV